MTADIGPPLTLLASQCAPALIDMGQLGGNVGFRSRAIRCASAICAGVYWCPVRCLNLYVWLTAPLQHAQIYDAR
jgi:hypothetical protein